MKLSHETERSFKESASRLSEEQTSEIRNFVRYHPAKFIPLVRQALSKIRKPSHVEHFLSILSRFPSEMAEAAPFVKNHLNRVFHALERFRHYGDIARSAWILEHCGDVRMLDLVTSILESPMAVRYLPSVDVYRYKRAKYVLSNRFASHRDVTARLDLELEKPDLRWIEETREDGKAL